VSARKSLSELMFRIFLSRVMFLGFFAVFGMLNVSCQLNTDSSTASHSTSIKSALHASFMPERLDCSVFVDWNEIPQGFAWQGLTIGVSSLAETSKVVMPDQETMQLDKDGYFFVVNPDSSLRPLWHSVEGCITHDKLTVLNIVSARSFPEYVRDWVAALGQPDRVTWGRTYISRTIIWAQYGVVAVIDLATGSTSNVILVPPIAAENLDTSWLIASLPKLASENNSDDGSALSGNPALEDPWGIER
jgi:hypothetical protein